MADRTRGYAHRVDVRAALQQVWEALTEERHLRRWCSPGAVVRPEAGGLFRASVDRIREIEAHIDLFEPRRRLRLIHLPSPELPPADSALVDDFLLEAGRDGTMVRLLGSGIPDSEAWNPHYLRLRTGWERSLARLKVYVEQHRQEEAR